MGDAFNLEPRAADSREPRSTASPSAASLPAASLTAVQRWMQAVISHPEGVESGLDSAEAREHILIDSAGVEQIIAPSAAQSSVERLAIYANAYYARLLECLGEEFPVVKQTLGDETFDAFAFAYLQKYPSRSYTLGKLGERFAQFLDETRPDDSLDDESIDEDSADEDSVDQNSTNEKTVDEGSRGAESADRETVEGELPLEWPDFLIDLVTLEWAFTLVFDGPGVEGEPLLSIERIGSVAPELWPSARLELVPCFRMLALRFPVNAFYAAARRGESPPMPPPARSWVAITRRDYVVRRHDLSEPQFALLTAIANGETVGAAIEQAASVPGADLDDLATELGRWFSDWTANGFFRAIVDENHV